MCAAGEYRPHCAPIGLRKVWFLARIAHRLVWGVCGWAWAQRGGRRAAQLQGLPGHPNPPPSLIEGVWDRLGAWKGSRVGGRGAERRAAPPARAQPRVCAYPGSWSRICASWVCSHGPSLVAAIGCQCQQHHTLGWGQGGAGTPQRAGGGTRRRNEQLREQPWSTHNERESAGLRQIRRAMKIAEKEGDRGIGG